VNALAIRRAAWSRPSRIWGPRRPRAGTARRSSSIATAAAARVHSARRALAPAGDDGQVDPRYLAMLLAYEDARFYDHDGVDFARDGARRPGNGRRAAASSPAARR
jgi:hypothetical protein